MLSFIRAFTAELDRVHFRHWRLLLAVFIASTASSTYFFHHIEEQRVMKTSELMVLAYRFHHENRDFFKKEGRAELVMNQRKSVWGQDFCRHISDVSRNFEWNEDCRVEPDVLATLTVYHETKEIRLEFKQDQPWPFEPIRVVSTPSGVTSE